MRWVRLLVSAAVMAAMLTVGVEGSSLQLGGKAAYAKKHHKKRHHKKHARRKHRKHARATSHEL
jgi:hypothetical protein